MERDSRAAQGERDGLTSAEVEERRRAGLVNVDVLARTKSVPQILADHILTLFNAVNLALAVLVWTTGQYRNMLFVGVVLSNLVVGTFQEIRAKRLVDALSIVTASRVRVRRDGREREVALDELVRDDLVLVSRGDQVPADGTVVFGIATANEDLLTGESAPVEKVAGSELLSGSYLDSGSVEYRVTRVGAEGYAARISSEAKRWRPPTSEISDTLSSIIRLATYALIPLGLGLFLRLLLSGRYDYDGAVLQAVAAVVGMIPQGLVLLTSGVMAIATTRLARRKVLVQQSYCVETLARVDVLCLDKTGTLTSGRMEVSSVVPCEGVEAEDLEAACETVMEANRSDANETARALLAHADSEGVRPLSFVRGIPFSSATKLSAAVLPDGGCLVVGAPQFVLRDQLEAIRGEVDAFEAVERVLCVARADGLDAMGVPEGVVVPLGFVALRDQMRENVRETVAFFSSQAVSLRVISGDDPRTVSAIAARAGIPGADRAVDASRLDPGALPNEVDDAVVFGRVTPQVKRALVARLRARGHVVAMTGDGVNDVLALRESDCAIAMASGSAATRNVADIVLADNDFARMPEVVAEGRRSINNLQRSAALFLTKTVYSAVLALISILIPPYPFIPIQMSLISSAVIGVPSFVLALEPNHDRLRGTFLGNVLSRSMPASAAIACGLLAAMVMARAFDWSDALLSTVSMIVMAAVGIALIERLSRPLTPLRVVLLAFSTSYVLLGVTVFRDFFRVAPMDYITGIVCAVTVACAIILFEFLYAKRELWSEESPFGRALSRGMEMLDGSRGNAGGVRGRRS
ncbi:HAD-IC family P-type ATPase [Olsenella porci]|uniref:HAD-IC family P-type ATPase n=1 Tax=Olsenella porci TaxID=2652279 RepID=A0A6N7XQD8_9ACTN|nr:HAD-IC family P-type ATPase [Olsenella porci]MST73194.1 HAD-IC family P-type ATPase [Olsenella porci]